MDTSRWVTAAVAAAVGLPLGSYLTVVIARVPGRAPPGGSGGARSVVPPGHALPGGSGGVVPPGQHGVLRPAGRCSQCAAPLRVADMIPLAGWVRLRGRCRSCGEPFGAWYPAAELITAAAFGAMGLRFGPSPVLPAFCYFAAISVALAFIDAVHKRLPDLLTLPSYPVALALLGVSAFFIPNGSGHLARALIGLAAAWLFYFLQAMVYPAGIGWGDVKLSGILGLYLGWFGAGTFVAGLLGGYVLAAAAGAGLILRGKATRKTQLPFGPFMLAGAAGAILASGVFPR